MVIAYEDYPFKNPLKIYWASVTGSRKVRSKAEKFCEISGRIDYDFVTRFKFLVTSFALSNKISKIPWPIFRDNFSPNNGKLLTSGSFLLYFRGDNRTNSIRYISHMRLFDFCLALARLVTVYIVPQRKIITSRNFSTPSFCPGQLHSKVS